MTPEFLARVHEVTEFCLAHAGKCFGGWSRETIFLYVGFHALAGSIFVVRRNGNITSVGFANPCEPGTEATPFDWHKVTPGASLVIREVIGTREACRTMFRQARARWPFVQRFFAYRHRNNVARLEQLQPTEIERFARG